MSMTIDPEIPDQKYVCLSIVSPKKAENDNEEHLFGSIKIRGVYGTEKEAKDRAQELQKIDPYFHIFIGDVGRWLPLDPTPTKAKNQIYYEKELNDLINGEVEQVNEIKLLEEQRKRDLLLKAKLEQEKNKEKLENPEKNSGMEDVFEKDDPFTDVITTNSEKRKKQTFNNDELAKQLDELDKMESEEKEKLKSLEARIKTKEQKLAEFEENLEKIKQLQKKINKKK